MQISEMRIVDVREPLTDQRQRLLDLLGSLSAAQWAASTAAPQWSVKDQTLHLLDVDLSWIAHDRDHEKSGHPPPSFEHVEFVARLGQRNQRWIDGARGLSPRLIIDLLAWAGGQLDAYLGTVDLAQPSSVYWAGDAPLWFDIAREFTERWVHYRQIREAVQPAGDDDKPDEYLALVVRTFVWGFPHQYRAPAAAGTTISLEITDIGSWRLTRTQAGWELDQGQPAKPMASLRMDGETAWRLLTGAHYDSGRVELSGDPALTGPLLQVRGIIG